MGNKIGIIDLGSNTFHLLISLKTSEKEFITILKERSFVGLAEKGISELTDGAMNRGISALTHFKSVMEHHGVENYQITGTAALRSAKNSIDFILRVKEELGFSIEVIDGDREAELIFKGVSILHPLEANHVIMDIGGGSVEFILVVNSALIWSKSYNIGVGVLYNQYHKTEPISAEERSLLNNFLNDELQELKEKVSNLKIDSIVGASGSFEVVESMNGSIIGTDHISEVNLEDYKKVSKKIINASLSDRLTMEGLPESRAQLIVVAMVLIDLALEIIQPDKILISPFALKEGLLSEL